MSNTAVYPVADKNNRRILPRQVAFAAAFLLPASKLLEAPSLLAKYAAGDILLPAIVHFLLQTIILVALLSVATASEQTLCERLERTLGKWVAIPYLLYAVYFLFAAALPLLDLEKFVYAAFFDTAPSTFSFAVFFLFSAFLCTKGVESVGKAADVCLFLFLLPFVALLVMSFTTADFSHLLPLFGTKADKAFTAFTRTSPHFSDAVLLLPLLANCRFKKKDGVKVVGGYGVGSALTLLFLAVFYAVYASLSPREHYAFAKISQYFPALSVVGRVDFLFIYMLSVVLLFYTCLPLQYVTELTARSFHKTRKTWFAAVLNLLLFLFALYFNRRYDGIYALISGKLYPVFWLVADTVPLFLLFLPKSGGRDRLKESKKENANV